MCNAIMMGLGFAIGIEFIKLLLSPLPSWLPAAVTPADWLVVRILAILVIIILVILTTAKGRGSNVKSV